jgi:hypothetical protein
MQHFYYPTFCRLGCCPWLLSRAYLLHHRIQLLTSIIDLHTDPQLLFSDQTPPRSQHTSSLRIKHPSLSAPTNRVFYYREIALDPPGLPRSGAS